MRRRAARHWQAVTTYLRGCDEPWASVPDMARTVRVHAASLHLVLVRMERLGVVKSRWDAPDRHPRRRLYALASRVDTTVMHGAGGDT